METGEALEVVDEHVRDPEVLEELQGDRVPEVRLQAVVCPDPVLTPHYTAIKKFAFKSKVQKSFRLELMVDGEILTQ